MRELGPVAPTATGFYAFWALSFYFPFCAAFKSGYYHVVMRLRTKTFVQSIYDKFKMDRRVDGHRSCARSLYPYCLLKFLNPNKH